MEAYAIEAQDLTKDHAGEKALKGVTFKVPQQALFGIIGADGAGKSTLMNILSTLVDPDGGSVRVLGMPPEKRLGDIRKEIGYMPQRFSLYQDLSVAENLEFFADIFGIPAREKDPRMRDLLDFAGLAAFRDRRAGLLSGGMKQKLSLACTLIHRPRLLLLDEPTVGVDPVARRDFWDLLATLRAQGMALAVSTPYMDEASLCEELIFLHQGRILARGRPADLLAAYPYRLFRLEGRETLNYPSDRPPPEGFALIYPMAGALHAAEPAGASAPAGDPLARLRAAIPEAENALPITPTLEDLFFGMLAGEEPA